MSRACTVCTRPDRDAVDAALLEDGASVYGVAKRFGIVYQTLRRHVASHLASHTVTCREPEVVARRAETSRSLLERCEQLMARAETLLEAAESSGEVRTALQALENQRRTLELIGRVSGELRDQGNVVALFVASPEWSLLESAIAEALRPFPEAAMAVRARVESLVSQTRLAIPGGRS